MVSFVYQGMATSVCDKDIICTDNAQIFGGKMLNELTIHSG